MYCLFGNNLSFFPLSPVQKHPLCDVLKNKICFVALEFLSNDNYCIKT